MGAGQRRPRPLNRTATVRGMVEKLEANDEEALHHYRLLAPNAVRNHPTEEHLLPLFFARGAGGTFSIEHSGFTYGALGMDIYRFG